MAAKNYLKDKLEEDELDLSMMQLTDVPVKDIEQLGTKVLKINLSHNLLTYVPANLPNLLSQIVQLDLSKNQLDELPENFGQLKNLKHLDLYANKISKLPVTFAQLKNLKWLDLKDNPLVPSLAQAAGPCITPNDCALCAKKVVALLQSMESQLMRERQRKTEEMLRARREQEKVEEAEREKVRQEKRAAKEKRRDEARQREQEQRRHEEEKMQHEMQLNGNGNHQNRAQNGNSRRDAAARDGRSAGGAGGGVRGDSAANSGGLCSLVFKILLAIMLAGGAAMISMLWVYTDGKMDSQSIQKALPVIQTDVDDFVMTWGHRTSKYLSKIEKQVSPYIESGLASGKRVWKDGAKEVRKGAKWLSENYGESFQSFLNSARQLALLLWWKVVELWRSLQPHLHSAWTKARPFFESLGKLIIEWSLSIWHQINSLFPVYVDWLGTTAINIAETVQNTWDKLVQVN